MDVDSLIIIPGITNFTSITTHEKTLCFNNTEWQDTITIYFKESEDLEMFLTSVTRDSVIENLLKK